MRKTNENDVASRMVQSEKKKKRKGQMWNDVKIFPLADYCRSAVSPTRPGSKSLPKLVCALILIFALSYLLVRVMVSSCQSSLTRWEDESLVCFEKEVCSGDLRIFRIVFCFCLANPRCYLRGIHRHQWVELGR